MNSEPEKTGLRQTVKPVRTKPNTKAWLSAVTHHHSILKHATLFLLLTVSPMSWKHLTFNPWLFPPQLDLSQPLEEQGPLDVIIHKLTDLILEADQNDSQAVLQVQRVQVGTAPPESPPGTALGSPAQEKTRVNRTCVDAVGGQRTSNVLNTLQHTKPETACSFQG